MSWPDRQDEFTANLDVVVDIGRRTGCSVFNALYGQRLDGVPVEEQDAVARERLKVATCRIADIGGTVLIEPLGRGLNGAYPLCTAADAAAVVCEVRESARLNAIGLRFDSFHLATSGDDLLRDIADFAAVIAHVQLANAPGRGEPGTGIVNVSAVVEQLWSVGYRGAVACEYKATVTTESSLHWIETVSRLRPLRHTKNA